MKPVPQNTSLSCPVCRDTNSQYFLRIGEFDYWRCAICEARFLNPAHQPNPKQEHAHYLLHENDPDDPGYRKFLSKLCDPLLEILGSGLHGLDYGCGPGPALAKMLREAGHLMDVYDPYFFLDANLLDQTYDFITCTEVVEHFYDPAGEFDRFNTMLRPGGWLAVMTCFQTNDDLFAEWHYRKDPTHVVFYREATLRWLAEKQGWRCIIPVKDVALMQKPV